ncbi:MAG: hypothetical protein LBQ33_00595, partial [Oscillospiraceae bacterium]|nr:hypothetical protein [Oscillospiraceae bacterium]
MQAELIQYCESGRIPFHMPGHKRGAALPGGDLPYHIDVTELPGLDNLHNPTGILREAMEKSARLWGGAEAFFLVGGSSCGILAGIRAATKSGDTVLVARNCHKSVFHAVELLSLRPVFLEPARDAAFGICGSLAPETVRQALEARPEAALCVLTS